MGHRYLSPLRYVLLITLLSVAGCNRNSAPDPAAANLAPAVQYTASQAAPPSAEPESAQQMAEAPQPPPPLPEYSQPECPGDNYIWTPGYWGYANTGYYWVPGAWVMAPYVDALWTPPYWDYYDGRYRWHAGYWGRHIGYYGGINYGFGYTGLGFYGGYWDTGGQFVYNRAVTRISTRVVNHYYSHSVANYTPVNHVSYNGPGGIARQPLPAELAVRGENRMSALPVQVEHMRSAAADRAQFAAPNRGRPAQAALQHPLATPYAAPAPRGERNGEVRQGAPTANGRPEAPANHEPFNRAQPSMPRGERGEMSGAAQAPPRAAEPRPANPGFREPARMGTAARPPEARGGADRRMEQNPAPQRAPQAPAQPRAEPHAAPHQNEGRPAPRQETRPQQNPAAQHGPQPHPQNEARPETRPPQNPGKEDHGRRGGQ